jgi:hypothetical protein
MTRMNRAAMRIGRSSRERPRVTVVIGTAPAYF